MIWSDGSYLSLLPVFLESRTPSHCLCCPEFGQHQSPRFILFLLLKSRARLLKRINLLLPPNFKFVGFKKNSSMEGSLWLTFNFGKPALCKVAKFGEQENLKWVVNRDVSFDRMKKPLHRLYPWQVCVQCPCWLTSFYRKIYVYIPLRWQHT